MSGADMMRGVERDRPALVSEPASLRPRFIAPELESTNARLARWRGLLESGPGPDGFVSAEECARAPIVAIRARRNILTAVYGRDIHGDVLNMERAVARISSGREQIFFWGKPEPIDRLRAALLDASGRRVDVDSVCCELGTTTLSVADALFGPGAFELTRTASVSAKADATAAHVALLEKCLGKDSGPDIIFAISRNAESRASLPGGAAIHRLHVRGLRSTFLGIWPSWLELVPGCLQVYDCRAVFAKPEAVLKRIAQASAPIFASGSAADLANAIMDLSNLAGVRASVRPANGDGRLTFTAHSMEGFAEWVKRRTFVSYDAARGRPIDALPPDDLDEASCIAVRMPLVTESVAAQMRLEQRGFRFCALEPPRDLPAWVGHWLRPCIDMDFDPPHYLLRPMPSVQEAALAAAIGKIILDWKDWSRARHV